MLQEDMLVETTPSPVRSLPLELSLISRIDDDRSLVLRHQRRPSFVVVLSLLQFSWEQIQNCCDFELIWNGRPINDRLAGRSS